MTSGSSAGTKLLPVVAVGDNHKHPVGDVQGLQDVLQVGDCTTTNLNDGDFSFDIGNVFLHY